MTDIFSKRLYSDVMKNQLDVLLPKVTQLLTELGYTEVTHQRISYMSDAPSYPAYQSHRCEGYQGYDSYQGLTRAWHQRFGQVMVKWAVCLKDKQHHFLTDSHIMTTTQNIAPPLYGQHQFNHIIKQQAVDIQAIVMPYCAQSLAQHIKTSLTDTQKHALIIKAAQVLGELHQSGWLHNDIKPSNVLFDKQKCLLTDFALAGLIIDDENSPSIAGTPAYLAPERWQGQGGSVQSDVYAFGVMMVEILVGTRPFNIDRDSKKKAQAWAVQHCQQPIPQLPNQYQSYQVIVEQALLKRVTNRYQSMAEVLAGLSRL